MSILSLKYLEPWSTKVYGTSWWLKIHFNSVMPTIEATSHLHNITITTELNLNLEIYGNTAPSAGIQILITKKWL